MLYKEGTWEKGFIVYLEAGRLYVGGWTTEDNERQEIFHSTELADTNWHHVGLILKDYQQERYVSFKAFEAFLDGEEFQSDADNNFAVKTITYVFQRKFTIGSNGGTARYHDGSVARGPRNNFGGIVDEFQLWNRGLTSREVRQLTLRKSLEDLAYSPPELSLASVDHLAGSVVVPPGMGIFLNGSAKGNGTLETKWETVIAPEGGQAIFENSSQPSTVANFSTPGYYKLRLSADNGLLKSAIDVDVHAGLEAGSNFQSPQEKVYYPMDEGSGEIVRNSLGDHYHGEIFNHSSMVSEREGISGTALQLDGIHNAIFIESNSPLPSAAEKKSFALWIKPDETRREDKEVILVAEDFIHSGFTIYLDGNLLYFGSWNEWLYPWRTFLPVPINRGQWHHLALVLDADYLGLHPNGLKAYLNGRQVASGLASGVGPFSPDSNSSLGRTRRVFPYHDGLSRVFTSYGFAGIIDEFHYYHDHALTIDEIGKLYAFGNVGPTVDAGPDQLEAPAYSMVQLVGSSTDDGRWASPVMHSWHILDGPEDGSYRFLENNGASAEFGPLIPGSYRIALGAYDGQVTTFDELMVTVRQPTPFESYMNGFPAIAVEDRSYHSDPDRDNWSNLVEYALGGAPDVGETYYQLGLKHELVMEAGYLYAEFRYPRRRDAAERGLRYEFEVSDDLSTGSWTRRGFYVLEVIPIDEIFEEVRLTIADPLDSANSRIFGRVRVIIDE